MPNKPTAIERARRGHDLGVPALSVAIGIAYLLAGWAGGDLRFGISGLVIMVVVAVGLVVFRGRSETVEGLLGHRDERINSIDLRATAFAGLAIIAAVIVGFIASIATGHDGWPYALLGFVGGTAYVAALVFLRYRG